MSTATHCDVRNDDVTSDVATVDVNSILEHDTHDGLFSPPLYKQRYKVVCQIIKDNRSKTVVDMGCAEGKFLHYVKECCPQVEEIVGVDVDRELLDRIERRIRPQTFEYVVQRGNPLRMSLYCGSIIGEFPFKNVDIVCCIEVIEHLYDSVLASVPFNLFGRLRPKLVVITTPNCEYNALFSDFSGLRHADHKFEWTRRQFKLWCEYVAVAYSYEVQFSGVGASKVGYCSQIATFTRVASEGNYEASSVEKDGEFLRSLHTGDICHHGVTDSTVCHRNIDKNIAPYCPNFQVKVSECNCRCYYARATTTCEPSEKYVLVGQVDYPADDLLDNIDERVLNEIAYNLFRFFSDPSLDDETQEVPLEFFHTLPNIKKFGLTREELVQVVKPKYQLTEDKQKLIFTVSLPTDDEEWSEDERWSLDDITECKTIGVADENEDWDLE